MKFERAAISARHLWSSPFVRWQGSLADVSSLDLAVAVTRDALARRQFDVAEVDQLVLGLTIPQPHSFYAVPWLAARLCMPGITGPLVAQACATSVACLVAAAAQVEAGGAQRALVVATDRTSNGPLLVYPRSRAMGGSAATEHWVLDNFAADPATAQSMVATAEAVAREGAMSRQALDDLTLLRHQQYRSALADDRAIQRRYLQPVVIEQGRSRLAVERDDGVHDTDADALRALKPVSAEGVVTYGSQTHPADGTAGTVVLSRVDAQALAGGEGVVRLLAAGFARAELARMPKAATTAAQRALENAGLAIGDVHVVTTHNPFAVNDVWFAQQTGYPLERMNPYGCSLVYGHPQGPTGLRATAELVQALRSRGGGVGLFTGCAAGDTGAALVVRVE
ncbi:MAG TPA: thiolase family protein [Burkholderiaceae bacterium]|nr:thiolase family protein [Burkholderiaceae bacterium]